MAAYLRLSREEAFSVNFVGHKVWYDEASQALILLRRGEFRAISLLSNSDRRRGEVFTRFKFDGTALDVKLSPCCRFVAVQRSDNEVEIIACGGAMVAGVATNSEASTLVCNGKGNVVLRGGVIWIRTNEQARLLLVTRDGLQVFQSSKATTLFQFQLLMSMFRIKYFWSLPSRQMVLVQTDEGEMRPFALMGNGGKRGMEKWAKFSTTTDGGPSPLQGEAALVELYGETWFVHIRKQEMILYLLNPTNTKRVKSVQSFHGSTYGISSIDSLLLAHSQQSKVSLLFDVLTRDKQVPGECFVSPLPVECPSSSSLEETSIIITPYSSSWVFLPPFWVLDARLGRVWKLELNLGEICNTYRAASTLTHADDELARFLIRRMNPMDEYEQDARDCLFNHMLQHSEMRVLNVALPWLRVLADHCEPNNNLLTATAGAIISQQQVCDRLFYELDLSNGYVATLALEYARFLSLNVYTSLAPPSEPLFVCIAKALLASKRMEELYQMCLFQLLPSQSAEVVSQVLATSEFCQGAEERKQVSLDALFRLQKPQLMFNALLDGEVNDDDFSQSIRFCVKHADVLLGQEANVVTLFKACHQDSDRLHMLRHLLAMHKPEYLVPGGELNLIEHVPVDMHGEFSWV
ncbi:hypothetical protein BASA81_006848 [Batrachochytrium salamandrivorans]|nr:hypothetical protein BASA81_006848 [Batrachochytrium salamandrivorans]